MAAEQIADEIPEARKRRLARERKAAQRARERQLGMATLRLELALVEREMVASMAAARGFEDQAEYLYALVRADALAMERDPSINPALAIVTCHAYRPKAPTGEA